MSETQASRPTGRQRVARRAAAPVEIPLARSDLEGLLQRHESARAVLRLAQVLELDSPALTTAPGRLAFFHEAFAARPGLLAAALGGDEPRMLREWAAYLQTQAGNPRCWHALAALLRERMIHRNGALAVRSWESLSALWLWLMCSVQFWEYFGAERWRPADGEPRGPLPVAEARELFEWAVEDWLRLHRLEAGNALAAGSGEKATLHARCLRSAGDGEEALRRGLCAAGWEPGLATDAERLAFASTTARALLAEWELEVLTKSAVQTGRHDHAAAIALLENYAGVSGGSLPVFIALLDAYLQSAEAEKTAKGHQFAGFSESAKRVVSRLEAMATPAAPLKRENVVLTAYYVGRGEATDDLPQRLQHANAALKWVPGDITAQGMHLYSRLNIHHGRAERWAIMEDCQSRGFDPSLMERARQQLESI